MMILLQSVRVKRPSVVTAVDVDVDVAAVASAEQWLCVLLTAVSGAAGAGGGQTGNCIATPDLRPVLDTRFPRQWTQPATTLHPHHYS